MMEKKPFCRRCLLEDMPDEAALARSIRELIDLLPEEKRSSAEVNAQRLSICRECNHLQNGMCVLCGCYVELRAAKRLMKCPRVPGRW